ncbi:regulator of initiation factor 2, putative [Plasmodium chabaudi chabaudi]|uniref:Regulator of initiation factor 2, putative n=1 Tax=Plasmodium chabaudi chabaudi TaxID=31271 RepID=A0A1C6YMT9_PLACU|nr:regulator of initiation factor 2, putative [Plasmodium chabaudi chabaudi]
MGIVDKEENNNGHYKCDTTEREGQKNRNSLTYLFEKNVIILDSFITTYLMTYFKDVEICLNNNKVNDTFLNYLKEQVENLHEQLRNNNEQCRNEDSNKSVENVNNEVISKDIYEHVENIHLDMLFLLYTNDEVEYKYNIIKMGIHICVEKKKIYISSGECLLVNKTWDGNVDKIMNPEQVTTKNTSDIINIKNDDLNKEGNKLVIVLKDGCNISEENKNKILNHLISNIKLHFFREEKEVLIGIQKTYNKIYDKGMSNLSINNSLSCISNFFFKMYEPDFYNCSIHKKNKICYKNLYDKYNDIMIKSKIIKLNKEMIKYLLIDSIFIPSYVKKNTYKNIDEDVYSSFSSYSDNASLSSSSKSYDHSLLSDEEENDTALQTSVNNKREDDLTELPTTNKDTKTSENNKPSERKRKRGNALFYNKNFRTILDIIKNSIDEFSNSVFIRVDGRNLKKGAFVNNSNLEINTLYDALLILKSCTSVYKELKENEVNKKNEHYLIISKYVNINICFLFEVYIYEKKIISISQKYLNHYFNFLNDINIIIDIIDSIKQFYETKLKNTFEYENYKCLLYIHTFKKTKKKKIILINAKSWAYKNKHPIYTNSFLKSYIYTNNKGVLVDDCNYLKHGIQKYAIPFTNAEKKENGNEDEIENGNSDLNKDNIIHNNHNLYFYDGILYYCIVKNDAILKKNENTFPKDLNYIKDGEIDIDTLMETIKKENNIQ